MLPLSIDIHTIHQTPYAFTELYAGSGSSSRLLALSRSGDITILDRDGKVTKSFPPGNFPAGVTQDVHRSFILPRASCLFLPSHSTPLDGEILIQLRFVESKLYLRVVAIDDDDALVELGDALVALEVKVR
jgi:hypothetical protein